MEIEGSCDPSWMRTAGFAALPPGRCQRGLEMTFVFSCALHGVFAIALRQSTFDAFQLDFAIVRVQNEAGIGAYRPSG